MDNHEESTLVTAHQPCEDCGSSDAKSEYSDGHTFCFACNTRHGGNRRPKDFDKMVAEHAPVKAGGLRSGEVRELKARMISRETCEAFQYLVGPACQIAQYFDAAGNVIAQKVRNPDKSFAWYGDAKHAGFFGKNVWKGSTKSVLVVTEGEVDTLSIYEVTKGMMPVVSVQNGAQSAAKTFKADLEWLESFDSVVLCFDNDEHGVAAAKECAALLSPGKAKLCELPLKDANDMLKAGRSTDLYTALKTAKVFRPDGLISGEDLFDDVMAEDPESDALFPFEGINAISRGLHYGELITVTAGIGTGKTSFLTEIAYSLQQAGHKVGMMLMEESVKHSARRIVGHHLNVPLQVDRTLATKEAIESAFKATVGSGNMVLYDHQGEAEMEHLLSKVRFMIKAMGVRFVIIDNLSTIVAGLDERDERKAIDKIMRSLWQLAQREQVVIFLAVHLKRIEGNKGHEDGVQTSLSHLRGSQSIASNSNLVIGLERNQQGDDINTTTVRILKNRLTGETGIACLLNYDRATGRLREAGGSPFTPATSSREPNSDF